MENTGSKSAPIKTSAAIVESFQKAMWLVRESLSVLRIGNAEAEVPASHILGDFDPKDGLNEVGLKLSVIAALKATGFQVESETPMHGYNIDLDCRKEEYRIFVELKCTRLGFLKTKEGGNDGDESWGEFSNKRIEEWQRIGAMSKALRSLSVQELLELKQRHPEGGTTTPKEFRDEDNQKRDKLVKGQEDLRVEAQRGALFISSVVAVSNVLAWWHLEVPGQGDTFRSIESQGRSIGELVVSLTKGYPEEREEAALVLAMLTRDEWTRDKLLGSIDVIVPALLRHACPGSREREWAVEALANLMRQKAAKNKMMTQLNVIVGAFVRGVASNRSWAAQALAELVEESEEARKLSLEQAGCFKEVGEFLGEPSEYRRYVLQVLAKLRSVCKDSEAKKALGTDVNLAGLLQCMRGKINEVERNLGLWALANLTLEENVRKLVATNMTDWMTILGQCLDQKIPVKDRGFVASALAHLTVHEEGAARLMSESAIVITGLLRFLSDQKDTVSKQRKKALQAICVLMGLEAGRDMAASISPDIIDLFKVLGTCLDSADSKEQDHALEALSLLKESEDMIARLAKSTSLCGRLQKLSEAQSILQRIEDRRKGNVETE